MKLLAALVTFALIGALAGCGEKVDSAADKAAADAKAKVVADAKAAEALLKEKEAQEIGIEAYMYAYPLVTMELTRRVSTNVVAPEDSKAPMGQFARLRGYPAVDNHTVTAPNADTLYTIVWLDVAKEPWIINAPDMKGRFFLLPMLDGWTTVFEDPGKRTTGTGAQKLAITGPGWSGTLPAGVKEYKSATGMVWLLGRIYCTGTPEDYKAVHALQDQMSAVPLSSYGKPYTPAPGAVDPGIDMKTAIRDQVNAMDAASYFKLFAQLMKTNPRRWPKTRRWCRSSRGSASCRGRISMRRSSTRRSRRVSPAAPKPAQDKIMSWLKEGVVAGDMKLTDGWAFTTKTGLYGTELSPARAGHRHRSRREPSAGRGLPDVGRAGPSQDVRAARRSTSCISTRANCRRSTASGR